MLEVNRHQLYRALHFIVSSSRSTLAEDPRALFHKIKALSMVELGRDTSSNSPVPLEGGHSRRMLDRLEETPLSALAG